jgi:NAD(P)H-hydrate repair Nnr-like enzyme with NAD(P)H-hydrate dehydratase domain
VKGETDYLANTQGILGTVSEPAAEAMETIGGTGDTLTGIVSALIDGGMPLEKAALAAMRSTGLPVITPVSYLPLRSLKSSGTYRRRCAMC